MNLKFKSKTMAHIESQSFWFLTTVILIMLVLYIYLVNATIFNIVTKNNAEEEKRVINAKMISIEAKYLALQREISVQRAREHDLETPKKVDYARVGHGTGLTRNNE